jgi:hypothetical protein
VVVLKTILRIPFVTTKITTLNAFMMVVIVVYLNGPILLSVMCVTASMVIINNVKNTILDCSV